MKTASKIFASLFTVLCLLAVGAIISGKTHQWVMAVASGVMAVAFWSEVMFANKVQKRKILQIDVMCTGPHSLEVSMKYYSKLSPHLRDALRESLKTNLGSTQSYSIRTYPSARRSNMESLTDLIQQDSSRTESLYHLM